LLEQQLENATGQAAAKKGRFARQTAFGSARINPVKRAGRACHVILKRFAVVIRLVGSSDF
jgi:hypothetical protein